MARDHSRTLQRRNELAYAQGYRGAGAGVSGAYKAARAARAAGSPLPTDRTAAPERRQIQPIGTSGRRLVRSLPTSGKGERVLRSQLDRASRVKITATMPDGRTVELVSKGGMTAAEFRRMVDQYGSVEAAVAALAAIVYGIDADPTDGAEAFDVSLDLT